MKKIKKYWNRLIKCLTGNIFGLNAKEGTIVAGLITVFTFCLHLIFLIGDYHFFMRIKNSADFNAEQRKKYTETVFFCVVSQIVVCSGITAVFGLFVSIWKEIYWGVGAYVIWVFLYEFAHAAILFMSKEEHSVFRRNSYIMAWCGLILRIFMEVLWLVFFIRYTIELYKISKSAEDQSRHMRPQPPKLKFAIVEEMAM